MVGRTIGSGAAAKPRFPALAFWEAPGTLAKAGFTGLSGSPPAAKNCDAVCPGITVDVRRVTPLIP